jgi:hypothetical protein
MIPKGALEIQSFEAWEQMRLPLRKRWKWKLKTDRVNCMMIMQYVVE